MFLCLTTSVNAQDPDPDLYDQTWYLYEIDYENGDHINVENWYPEYTPYVIIDESLNFNGMGLCNFFDGTLEYVSSFFTVVASNVTTNNCNDPYNYEEAFIGPFGYIGGNFGFVEIIDDSDGFQTMKYITGPFTDYTYRNTPILATDDFKKNVFSLYPNPTKGVLNFYCENETLESVSIFSVTGTKVLQLSIDSSNSINLSSLNKGLYFVEITYSEVKEVNKIIKN